MATNLALTGTLLMLLCAGSSVEVLAGSVVERIRSTKELRFGSDIGTQPWIWQKSGGTGYSGFEYDIIRYLTEQIRQYLKLEKLEPRIKMIAWEQIPNSVNGGDVDIGLNAWFRPPEISWKPTLWWSDCYFDTGLSILYPASFGREPTIDDLRKAKSVGIYPDPLALEVAEKLGLKTVHLNDQDYTYARELNAGTFEFVLHDRPFVLWEANNPRNKNKLSASRGVVPGSDTCYAAVAPASDKDFHQAINAAIRNLRHGSILADILKGYGL